jgi:hypothetical protein
METKDTSDLALILLIRILIRILVRILLILAVGIIAVLAVIGLILLVGDFVHFAGKLDHLGAAIREANSVVAYIKNTILI